MSGVRLQTVGRDEDGMRLDRWFGVHFPQVTFGHLQKLIRTGQVRIDSGRAKTNSRLEAGQLVRVPPLEAEVERIEARSTPADAEFLRDLILYEDDELYVFNKPHGLASQGGSGTKRHMDGLLKSLPNKQGEAPRLVHRLDRDTSGVLVVAKTRAAATLSWKGVPVALGAKDLLGDRLWRTEAGAGQHLVLSRQADRRRPGADGGGRAELSGRAALQELLFDHRHRRRGASPG